eukprot:5391304-Amphidinium_carterae.1
MLMLPGVKPPPKEQGARPRNTVLQVSLPTPKRACKGTWQRDIENLTDYRSRSLTCHVFVGGGGQYLPASQNGQCAFLD